MIHSFFRAFVLILVLVWLAACALLPAPPQSHQPVDTIAFGSCANQSQPQPIWEAVLASRPDLFVFLGDNIYGDTVDPDVLRAKYLQLGQKEGYQRLRASTEVIATWDDHDYGANDIGAENPIKVASKQIFLDFFGEPAASERRLREGGIYTAYTYGPAGQRVQVILLDTRWDRSPIHRVSAAEYDERKKVYAGPYTATTGPNARLLGEDQWRWLEDQLRQPAQFRIVATSIPFLQDGTGWETWANFPDERDRFLALMERTRANGVIFITGDTHRAQFSRLAQDVPYPLWEVNSSGLTENWQWVAPDKNRVGTYYAEDNYGLIHINWTEADPELTLEIRAVDNGIVMQHKVRLSELQVRK
ncbi:MAG: alkaline phosphatase family protein [Caldilineaceae bacterium]|nr:alkaline phosphatase family protein [Caldilineaceae bacterium]